MPNRIIKESICESRKLSEVSFFAEDLYKRLITYADDYGRFNADYQIILARLYPREIGIVSIDDIEDAMTELIGVEKIAFYTSEARKEIYGCFPNWAEHQRVRDSKKKCPEPDDTTVNDWYFRRFVSRDMKRKIIERDKMKCKGCGKFLFADMPSADRAIKFGGGLFHIDHIVPVNQGGRATEENLQLLCNSCNLRRKRHFTVEEIIEFSKNPESSENLQESAEICGKLQKVAASSGFNPIQSESESNPNPNPAQARKNAPDEKFDRFWAAYPNKKAKQDAFRAFQKLKPDDDLLNRMLAALEREKESAQWQESGGRFIPHPATWLNGRRWEDETTSPTPAQAARHVVAQDYPQRDYEIGSETPDQVYARLFGDAG